MIDGCVLNNRPNDTFTGKPSQYGHPRLIKLFLDSDVGVVGIVNTIVPINSTQ